MNERKKSKGIKRKINEEKQHHMNVDNFETSRVRERHLYLYPMNGEVLLKYKDTQRDRKILARVMPFAQHSTTQRKKGKTETKRNV